MAKKNAKKGGAPMGEKKLVILDSHAILHRAYHAIPDFSSSRGEPTGALYGLVSTLLKLVGDLKPDYIVATRDLPGPTHRHEKFEAYKATRVKAEDALVAQLTQAPKVFEAFGIPLYEAPGFEADDVIGSIVKQLSKRGDISTVIATGDMDTLQLVNATVKIYTMRKGITDTVLYDADAVRERFGFGPEHVVDYKALRGDPSDNIKGIKGIGEKTATELIRHFGSVEDMYAALEKTPKKFAAVGIKPRVVEILKAGRGDALLSKQLASIHMDAPVSFKLPERTWRLAEHAQDVSRLCDELEFRSLKERVRAAAEKAVKTAGSAEAEEGETQAATHELFPAPVRTLPATPKDLSIALWLLRSDLTDPDAEAIAQYAKTDDLERARALIFKELQTTGRLNEVFEKIEKPLIPVVGRMNAAGVYLDVAYLHELGKEYRTELEKLAARVYAHAGHEFNINSPRQLGAVLFDELNLLPPRHKKTPGGARTTREEELEKLTTKHPIIADVLAYRELQKLLSTYVEKMGALADEEGRLHAQFLQAGTTTGRMSSQNPNLQNIPIKSENGRRIRRAFAAPRGKVLAAIDYSQIELRIAAGLAKDKKLTEVFRRGGDVHAAVASEVFNVPVEKVDYEMRRRAKVINFGILYGMGVNALKQTLGAEVTREDAAAFLSEYFKDFAGLARFVETVKAGAAKRGYTETLFGRRRYFPGFRSPLPNIRAQAERMAVNAPIQGTQADIIKLAMVAADELIEKKKWRGKAQLLLQVHDELVYELDEKEGEEIARELKGVMEHVVSPNELGGVPIVAEVSIGENWGDMRRVASAIQ